MRRMTSTPSPMPCATPDSHDSRIVLGVTGGIAAYKAVEVLRRLRDAGYFVSPVLTPDATRFVGALTFSALGSEPARVALYGDASTPIPHTYLGQHADLIVVAPATAHFIARYAMGLADDLLSATLLATRAPVLVCPAMHAEMWEQPSVQENLATLRRRGVLVLEPARGRLAGGDEGVGRLAEPEDIVALARQVLEGVLDGEGTPTAVADARGLELVRDASALDAAVDRAIAANPDVAAQIRDGKVQAVGALIGQVMKEMRGQADAGQARGLILEKLK